jgi:hypothetical protein
VFRFRTYFSELTNLFGQLVGFLWGGIGPTQGLYLHTGQHNTEKRGHIRASSGIRTHDPSVRATEDSTCLTPLGHWFISWRYDNCTEHRVEWWIECAWLIVKYMAKGSWSRPNGTVQLFTATTEENHENDSRYRLPRPRFKRDLRTRSVNPTATSQRSVN